MREHPVVALLGDLNVDVMVRAGTTPPPGGETHAEAALCLGGSAALTARWLSALGCDVRLAAAIGDDPFGAWVCTVLSREGMPATWLQRTPQNPTGLCFAVVHTGGERTLFASPGAARDLSWDRIPGTWLDGADWLHLSGYAWAGEKEREAAERALHSARERAIPVSLDPGAVAPALRTALQALPAVDLLLPNRRESSDLSRHDDPLAAAAELRHSAAWVATKLDRDGCLVANSRGVTRVPAAPVEAGNTTGAGDAFNAGAIAGILCGWEAEEIGTLANVLGGAATRAGGGGALPALSELLALLDSVAGSTTLRAWLRTRWAKGET